MCIWPRGQILWPWPWEQVLGIDVRRPWFLAAELLSLYDVCLSVTRVYCDKTAAVRIMQFSAKCSPMPYLIAFQV